MKRKTLLLMLLLLIVMTTLNSLEASYIFSIRKWLPFFLLCCLNEPTHVKSEEVKVSKVAKSMINPSWLINMILVAMAAGLYLCKRTSTNLMERHKSLLLECHI